MHKYLISSGVLCLIFFAGMPACAYKVKTFQPLRINPLEVPYSPYQAPAVNESYPKITQIEYALFKKAYEKQNIYTRLARIERKIFKKAFNNLPLATRMENITNNMDAGVMYNISSSELSKLERKVLGRTYEGDDTESRITRMEKEMLGAMQSGNLKTRLETIKTASKHYNSYPEIIQSQTITPQTIYPQQYYNQPPMAYYPQSYGYRNWNQSRGLGGFLKNMFGAMINGGGYGTMTGYTPPIYAPYSRFDPGIGIRNEYYGNQRRYIRNKNYGTGSSVRILD